MEAEVSIAREQLISEIAAKIVLYYADENAEPPHGAGGVMHVVTDDMNVGDQTIRDVWCEALQDQDLEAMAILSSLLMLTEEDRKVAIGAAWDAMSND